MSSRARALIVVGATLAAMHMATITAVAHAQATDEPTSSHDTRPPPSPAADPESGRRSEHGHTTRWGCRVHPSAPSALWIDNS